MIKKRFTMKYGKYIDNENNVEYDEKWESYKICDLLNELDSENQRLKLENDGLRYVLKNIKQIDVEIDIGD